MKEVWIDLKLLAKDRNKNRKPEKKKKKEEKNIQLDPGRRFGPDKKPARGPGSPHARTGISASSLPTLTLWPHPSAWASSSSSVLPARDHSVQ
jgi:hypothetical protein